MGLGNSFRFLDVRALFSPFRSPSKITPPENKHLTPTDSLSVGSTPAADAEGHGSGRLRVPILQRMLMGISISSASAQEPSPPLQPKLLRRHSMEDKLGLRLRAPEIGRNGRRHSMEDAREDGTRKTPSLLRDSGGDNFRLRRKGSVATGGERTFLRKETRGRRGSLAAAPLGRQLRMKLELFGEEATHITSVQNLALSHSG